MLIRVSAEICRSTQTTTDSQVHADDAGLLSPHGLMTSSDDQGTARESHHRRPPTKRDCYVIFTPPLPKRRVIETS
jgi:hypothetical protein